MRGLLERLKKLDYKGMLLSALKGVVKEPLKKLIQEEGDRLQAAGEASFDKLQAALIARIDAL